MSNDSGSPGKSNVGFTKSVSRKALVITLFFSMLAALCYVVVFMVLYRDARINIRSLFPAMIGTVACIYLSCLVQVILAEPLSTAFAKGLRMLSIAVLISLVLMFLPGAPFGSMIFCTMLLATGATAFLAYCLAAYSEHLWLMGRGIAIAMLALTLSDIAYISSSLGFLNNILLLTGMAVAGVSFIGILDDHSNDIVRRFGIFFRKCSNMISLTVLLFVVLLYMLWLRDALVRATPEWATLAEWSIIAVIISIVVFRFWRFFKKEGQDRTLGDWKKLIQVISVNRGDGAEAYSAVEDFIERGEKEALLVLIVGSMHDEGASPIDTAKAISDLARYSENEPVRSFSWAIGDATATRRRTRTGLAIKTLDAAVTALGASYMSSRTASVDRKEI